MQIFVKATIDDLNDILNIIEQAKVFQNSQGFIQWTSVYPVKSDVLDDLTKGIGYVLKEDGVTIAYVCIDFGGDASYSSLNSWSCNKKYATWHRLAIADGFRGKGISKTMFDFAKQISLQNGYDYIRIDTSPQNEIMKRAITSYGFTYRGVVYFMGKIRHGYDLTLSNS